MSTKEQSINDSPQMEGSVAQQFSGVPVEPKPPIIRQYTGRPGFVFWFCRFVIRVFFRLWLRGETAGAGNVPAQGGVLIVPTHTSFLDPPLAGSLILREVCLLSRAEILEVPLLGVLCRRLNAYPVRRGQADRKAIRLCQAILRSGWPLVFFPEGTRSRTGQMGPINKGFALILQGAGHVPYLPVVLQDTYRVMRPGWIIPRPRKVQIYYGQPKYLPERERRESTKAYHNRCARQLEQDLRDLGAK